MPSICTATLSPMVAAVSTAISSGGLGTNQAFARVAESCSLGPNTPNDVLTRAVDNKVLCTVMCCCQSNPSIGKDGRNLKQQCVDETLSAADRALNYRSRYKSEISYNMEPETPVPFMHRDATGADTTQPSTYWRGRAQSEIEGYTAGDGNVRRPDVVIVNNVDLPPYAKNIARVVEMKFLGDPPDMAQDEAYRRIAGGEQRYTRMMEAGEGADDCRCQNGQPEPVPVPVVVPAPQTEPEGQVNWWRVAQTGALGVATVVGVIATVALAISPFDGPAGEMAAGAGTWRAAAQTAKAYNAIFAAP